MIAVPADNVIARKGFAEASFLRAKKELVLGTVGKSMTSLDEATRAAKECCISAAGSTVVATWKLWGDIETFYHFLPVEKKEELEGHLENGLKSYKTALEMAARHAKKIQRASLNADCAVNRYYRSHLCSNDSKAKSAWLHEAEAFLKAALQEDSENSGYWNALGVVTMETNKQFSQHPTTRPLGRTSAHLQCLEETWNWHMPRSPRRKRPTVSIQMDGPASECCEK
jgi:hypothetical protein